MVWIGSMVKLADGSSFDHFELRSGKVELG